MLFVSKSSFFFISKSFFCFSFFFSTSICVAFLECFDHLTDKWSSIILQEFKRERDQVRKWGERKGRKRVTEILIKCGKKHVKWKKNTKWNNKNWNEKNYTSSAVLSLVIISTSPASPDKKNWTKRFKPAGWMYSLWNPKFSIWSISKSVWPSRHWPAQTIKPLKNLKKNQN